MLGIEDEEVIEPLGAVMAAMEEYFVADNSGGVVIPSCGLDSVSVSIVSFVNKALRVPAHFIDVEDVEVVEGALAVPASEDIEAVAHLVAGVGSAVAWLIKILLGAGVSEVG